jgi:hypothetical protein
MNETKYQIACEALTIMAQRYRVACEALVIMAQRYKDDTIMKEDNESIFGVNERKIAALEQRAARAERRSNVANYVELVCLLVIVVLLIVRITQ